MAAGAKASRVWRGAFQSSPAATKAKSDSAGNSQATVKAPKKPARAKIFQPRSPSYQIRHAAYSVMTAHTAAGKWLLIATANVVRYVPNAAAASTKIRPQSVRPNRSTKLASTKK